MNDQQIKNLERNALYTLRIHDGLKESTVNDHLDELNKRVMKEIKRNELAVIVMKVN